MKTLLTRESADKLAKEYAYLIGQSMPYPHYELPITSITVEKNKKSKGFTVILSHDIFDNGGCPEIAGLKCPQVDLMSYLNIPDFL